MSIYGDTGIYERLESWLADYYKQKYVILTNTGTSSLNSGYVGLGIARGDEVIVPTYTFLATVTPLLRLGAIPVFADAAPVTGGISPKDIEEKITPKTKAIAVTHMWGVACDMESIMYIAQKNNLRVLEDCSHAHFTKYNQKLLGTFGDVACFSIGAKKTLTSGEGGFMMTNDPEVYSRATLLGHFEVRASESMERVNSDGFGGIYTKYKDFCTGFGENYRMHPYSAVMAYSLLSSGKIFDLIEKRGQSLRYFSERLKELSIITAPVVHKEYFEGAMYGYKCKFSRELLSTSLDETINILRNHNMEIKTPDSTPLHEKPLFLELDSLNIGYDQPVISKGVFSGVKEYFNGRVSLPTFSRGLADDKPLIDEYIRCLQDFEHKYKK